MLNKLDRLEVGVPLKNMESKIKQTIREKLRYSKIGEDIDEIYEKIFQDLITKGKLKVSGKKEDKILQMIKDKDLKNFIYEFMIVSDVPAWAGEMVDKKTKPLDTQYDFFQE